MAGDMYAVRMPVQVLYERWPSLDQQRSITAQTIIDSVRECTVFKLKEPLFGHQSLNSDPIFPLLSLYHVGF